MPNQIREGRRFLEHVTDAFVEAWGETFERALAQAALGFSETIVDIRKIRPTMTEEIETSGHDELELLYNWLEELLLRFEIDRLVFGEFEVAPVSRTDSALHLTARAKGEPFQPSRHAGKVEVKGVTYHMMVVERAPDRITVRYILDL